MAQSVNQSEAQKQVEHWLSEEFDQPLEAFNIIALPYLGTPHFALFMIEQKKIRTAGDLYVMSDGEQVLLASQKHFAQVLNEEAFLKNPEMIPAKQVAELYLRMAEARTGGILTKGDEFPLQSLSALDRAQFAPPSVEKSGNNIIIRFWSTGASPMAVSRWEVIVQPDYTLKSSETALST